MLTAPREAQAAARTLTPSVHEDGGGACRSNRALIALLGGTFDPVHFGHLRTALEVHDALACDELRLVPCSRPPHREMPVASARQRLEMLRLAVAGVPGFTVDEREIRRDGPSYMVDTLASLRTDCGDVSLCLIIGMDAFVSLDTWHEWRRLPELAHFLVVERPGVVPPEKGAVATLLAERCTNDLKNLRSESAGRIVIWSGTQLEISATAIRSIVADGRNPSFLLPNEVIRFINKEGLYIKR